MPPPGLLATSERAAELKAMAAGGPSWALDARQQGELELLVSGAFWPLTGYASAADHASILAERRLADGSPWPIPITLDVTPEVAGAAVAAGHLALREAEGVLLAVLTVDEHFVVDVDAEALALYDSPLPEGTTVVDGPGWWRRHHHPDRLAGTVEGIEPAAHWSFPDLRLSPAEVDARMGEGTRRVVASVREPLHRMDMWLVRREWLFESVMVDVLEAPEDPIRHEPPRPADGAQLVVLGLVGPGADDPFDPHLLVRLWGHVLDQTSDGAALVVIPLGDHGTGGRDTELRRRAMDNYGAGASGGVGVDLVDLWAQAEPTGLEAPSDRNPHDRRFAIDTLTPAELRRRLATGQELPIGFTDAEVRAALFRHYPPLAERGLVLLLSGLSGSGKSTVAQALAAWLADHDDRSVALLDGDRVRHHLSSELGFSREHRTLNVRRIGFVAAEIGRAGGIAICAPIAPYDEVRRDVREMVADAGASFVLVHVSTPLEVCEARDRKGLYAKARAGQIPEFTGISDPYDVPADAELAIDTTDLRVTEAVGRIVSYLHDTHLIR